MGAPDLAAKAGAPASARRLPIPPFTAEHDEFRVSVRRFVERELYPHAAEWEAARWFPNGPDHPHLGLLRIQLEEVQYWDEAAGRMVKLEGFARSEV